MENSSKDAILSGPLNSKKAECEKNNIDEDSGSKNEKKRTTKSKGKLSVSKIKQVIQTESEDEDNQIINTKSKNSKGVLGKRNKRKFSEESEEDPQDTNNSLTEPQISKKSPEKETAKEIENKLLTKKSEDFKEKQAVPEVEESSPKKDTK